MPHAESEQSLGLQALILCGPGSSFSTFTTNSEENPKALLPIANRPMVWYPIDFCYRMGLTDITLICTTSTSAAIATALNTNPFLTGLPNPKPEILAPKDLSLNSGTADILRLPEVRDLVTADFLVLPCDLVCDLDGDKLLQAWMVQSASFVPFLGDAAFSYGRPSRYSGGLGVWYETKTATPLKGEETDFLAVSPISSTTVIPQKASLVPHLSNLVLSMPTDSYNDLTGERNGFPVRHGLLQKHPRVRMLTTHRDAHIYILPRWIMDFIQLNDRLESIGEDVIGWWAKAGWQPGLREKLHMNDLFDEVEDDELPTKDSGNSSEETDSDTQDGEPSKNIPDQAALATTPRITEQPRMSHAPGSSQTVPSFLAYIHPVQENAPIIRRVDTAKLLLSVSLQLAKLPSMEESGPDSSRRFAHAKKVTYAEGVKPRTTITRPDCLVADNVTVEEKSAIKESVIGANCQINEGAKLLQCLLMDGVVVGKSCKLTRCILGKRCVIGDGSILTDCEVQENLMVEPGTEQKDDKLMSSEGLEATEEELQEILEEENKDVAVC